MRSNRSHLGSRHLALEPGRVRYSVVKGKTAGRSTPGYPAAIMFGGMSVVIDLKDAEKEASSDPLTIDFMGPWRKQPHAKTIVTRPRRLSKRQRKLLT